MTDPRPDADVLVVGAGPSGLVAAVRLRELGFSVRIVDAAAAPARESRATLMHAATVEIMTRIGIERPLLGRSARIASISLADDDRVLARMRFADLGGAHPFALSIPQNVTEGLLITRLAELGVQVERGVQIEGLARQGQRLAATGRSLRDDASWTATSKYLVGADGAHSTVRGLAGIPFDGAPYDEDFVLADVQLAPPPVPPDEARIVLSPHGVTVLGRLPSGRYRIVATAPRGVEPPRTPDREFLDELLRARGIRTRTVSAPEWSSRFRIGHRVARRLRAGRILLCGDAAHVHSPAAGQGMNTGIADAYDLAESIAADTAGDATALDRYERRRLRAARQVVGLTGRITRVALVRGRLGRVLRDSALRVLMRVPRVRRALIRSISGLDRSPLGRPR
jgi:2-polyprenyl-6-methoxyphenol hydroxylase-like FAD-dependent oxidoreductase